MITTYINSNYRITYEGVSMVENALGNPNLVQISVTSGCTIVVPGSDDNKKFGIDYLPNGEARSWKLNGLNTRINKKEAHFIFARLGRNEESALLIFSTNDYRIDGSVVSGGTETIPASDSFFYIKVGSITATDAVGESATLDREITYDGGYYRTDNYNDTSGGGWGDMFTLTADGLINALKEFASFTVRGTLSVIGKIVLNEKQITDIAREMDDSPVIDDETVPTTAYLNGKYLLGLAKKFLRKDQQDSTSYLIKLLGGLEIGEAIDSMIAGKGILADTNGRMQLSRLEVRDSLTVMRLIINEIQAMAGDFTFSDCGTIENVELMDGGIYRLTMEKRTDTDWTTLEKDDVLYSIVNSLLTGGTDYYTSWFRVISKNRNENTLTVVLYPDNEVPGGKNYPPVAGYNVARRGNAEVPDAGEIPNGRAQSWLLSSREGRIMFLQNVFKPILEDYNYALTLGRFPNVRMIEKLPISPTDVGVMSKIGVFEKIYEADWNGTIIPKKVDRGEWSLVIAQGDEPYRFVDYETLLENQKVTTTLEQHTVYHYGCKWGCVIDRTTDEPRWNSAGWTLLEGDKNYHLDFTSTAGWQFFRNGVNTDIAAVVSYGNRDITNVLMATTGVEVEWLRDTGDIPADNSWSPAYVDGQRHVIRLTSADMGSEWGFSVRTVKFICRIFIPVGEDVEKVENYVGFRI